MNDEDDFTRNVKRDLRRMVDETSPQIRARLDRAVGEAIEGRARPRGPVRRFGWPIGAMAATFFAATLGMVVMMRQEPPASPADDVALLLNVDNFELLDQMEFYQWLDRQPGILEGEGGAAPRPPQRS